MENDELEREAYQLVRGHVATNFEEAKKILKTLEEKRKKSDLAVFYTDFQKAKDFFGKALIDEKPYNYSNIRMGFVPSGFLEKISEVENLAFGKIIEFVPKEEGYPIRLVALVKNFNYQEREGIFLIDSPAEEVRKRGAKTFDDRYPKELYRMEFKSIGGDALFGMFYTWNTHEINDQASLILYNHKSRILSI